MKKTILAILATGLVVLSAFTTLSGKYVTKGAHINFFSHTDVEDIKADNYKGVSTIDSETGVVIFSIPMQSFEFPKALMQKHFNSPKFLDTKQYPKAKFKGKITNLKDINFSKDGVYEALVDGEMTIKGVTKPSHQKGTIEVKNGELHVKAKTKITLADFGIAFEKGKPSTNIAKTIDVTVDAKYKNKHYEFDN